MSSNRLSPKGRPAMPPASLSRLESLPCEILIEIYQFSRNPSFIFSCPEIHSLVQLCDVKIQLIEDCCTDDDLGGSRRKRPIHNLRMLLLEPWLSLGWLMEAAWPWLREAALRLMEAVERQHGHRPESDEQKARLVEHLDNFLPTLQLQSKSRNFQHDMPNVAFASCSWKVQRSHDHHRSYSIILSWPPAVRVGPSRAQLGQPGQTCKFVGTIDWRVFPRRMLTGPWTQTDGDIMSFFLPSVRKQDKDGSVPKATQSQLSDWRVGLSRAIATGHIPALHMLTGGGRSHVNIVETYTELLTGHEAGVRKEVDTKEWKIARLTPGCLPPMPTDVLMNEHFDQAKLKLDMHRKQFKAGQRRGFEVPMCFADRVFEWLLKDLRKSKKRDTIQKPRALRRGVGKRKKVQAAARKRW